MIESPMDLIKKAKQTRKFEELHSHTHNDNSRTLAVANSSYGRLVEHTRVAPQITQIIRGTVKESPIHLRQLYNDPINKIKKQEMPTKDQLKLGRHRDPSPIEINLTRNFVNLNQSRTKMLEPGQKGGCNWSLFTVKHHISRTPRMSKTPPKTRNESPKTHANSP